MFRLHSARGEELTCGNDDVAMQPVRIKLQLHVSVERAAYRYNIIPDRVGWNNLQYVPNYCLHLVGGGAQNGLLCQLTADAWRRP